MTTKVSELNPPELDFWVAEAEGYRVGPSKVDYDLWNLYDKTDWCVGVITKSSPHNRDTMVWAPSTDWSQGGPIIEKGEIRIRCADDKKWWAERRMGLNGKQGFCTSFDTAFVQIGPTPLIAAMRVRVSSKYGEDIDDTR